MRNESITGAAPLRGLYSASPGFSLVSGMIGLSILLVAVMGMIEMGAYFRSQDVRLDRNIAGQQIMTTVAAGLQASAMTDLVGLCTGQGALNAVSPGKCVDSSTKDLSATAVYDPAQPSVVGVRRSWLGDYKPDGTACVDLVSCNWLASGHLLEVTLKGIWYPSGVKNDLISKTLVFRKAP